MTATLPNRIAAAVLAIMLVGASQADAAEASPRPLSHAERNGEAEARADLAAGRPLKLYTHAFNGRIPMVRFPGLVDCYPDRLAKGETRVLLAPLPDADWQEGETYTDEQTLRAQAARRFASQYNRTILRAYRAELAQICPNARLVD